MNTGTGYINAVIGDLSAVRAGIPVHRLGEQTRIRYHLQFVRDYLADSAPRDLTTSQRRNRRQVL